MNVELIEKAKTQITSIPVLVNVVSRRVRQLNKGERPLVKPLSLNEDKEDIALREIAEGKLLAQIDFGEVFKTEEAHSRWS